MMRQVWLCPKAFTIQITVHKSFNDVREYLIQFPDSKTSDYVSNAY